MEVNVKTGTFVRFWLVILGFIAVAALIYSARWALTLTFISLFLAVALNPFVAKIMIRIPKISRTLAAVISYLVVVAVIGVVVALVVPVATRQVLHLAETLPAALETSSDSWAGVNNFIDTNGLSAIREQIFTGLDNLSGNLVGNIGSNFLSGAVAFGRFLVGMLLVLVMTFLFLNSGPAIYANFYKKLRKTKQIERVHSVLMRMRFTISHFMMGQLVIAIIDAIVVTIAIFTLCLIFGVDLSFALPLGLLAGTMTLVPMFGALIATFAIFFILMLSSVPAAIIFAVFFIVYQQIENNIIIPKVQSKHSELPALVVLVVVLIGTSISGLLGAIVSIPIAGCIKILMDEYLFTPDKNKNEQDKLAEEEFRNAL
ncbi:MAG: AI-2E family transporter [Candidatus Nomurabacteria bacterium]|jgi:predicted PurR-regulated permease PerM|nr:AI-2E family transporter [Candidatus Nomurabacteria bacterium]